METSTVVTMKNSSTPKEISFDSWKIVIEYLNNDSMSIGFSRFKTLFSYRLISKIFNNVILDRNICFTSGIYIVTVSFAKITQKYTKVLRDSVKEKP